MQLDENINWCTFILVHKCITLYNKHLKNKKISIVGNLKPLIFKGNTANRRYTFTDFI